MTARGLPSLAYAVAMSIVCGHRGHGKTRPDSPHPENTLPSLRAAITAGATMLEFDVLVSADGVPVLMHDDTLERTTDGSGCVSAATLDALRALDASIGTSSPASGVRIPTLAEALAAVSVDLNVEIKAPEGICAGQERAWVAERVLAELRADPGRTTRSLLVSSFDLELLRVFRAVDDATRAADAGPAIPIAFLVEDPALARSGVDAARDAGCVAYHPDHAFITPDLAARCERAGLALNTWTVNDPARAAELTRLGVHAIITDEPATIRDALSDRLA